MKKDLTLRFSTIRINIFIVLLIYFCIQPSGLKSQNNSTVGEIHDFEVGDIFHFNKSAGDLSGWSGMWSIKNIEILDKFFSSNSDTLYYVRDIDYQIVYYPENELTYSYYIDTIFFTNLNSILQADSVYTNINLYNGRTINYIELSSSPDNLWNRKYVNGCGLTSEQFYQEIYNSESSDELVYYKKGDEEWGTPILVSVENTELVDSEILVYPNPAKKSVKILSNKFDNGKLTIFTVNGIKVKSLELNTHQTTVDISKLNQGVYIFQIYINERIFYKKLIKE